MSHSFHTHAIPFHNFRKIGRETQLKIDQEPCLWYNYFPDGSQKTKTEMVRCSTCTISEQDEGTSRGEPALEKRFLYKHNEMSGSRGIPINHYYSLLFLSLLHEMHAAMDLRPFSPIKPTID